MPMNTKKGYNRSSTENATNTVVVRVGWDIIPRITVRGGGARQASAMMRKKNERQIRSKMVEEQAKQQGSGAQMTVESMKNDVV